MTACSLMYILQRLQNYVRIKSTSQTNIIYCHPLSSSNAAAVATVSNTVDNYILAVINYGGLYVLPEKCCLLTSQNYQDWF